MNKFEYTLYESTIYANRFCIIDKSTKRICACVVFYSSAMHG